jgi:hypothetical protein
VVCSRRTPLGSAQHHADFNGLVERVGNPLEEAEGVAFEIVVLKIGDDASADTDPPRQLRLREPRLRAQLVRRARNGGAGPSRFEFRQPLGVSLYNITAEALATPAGEVQYFEGTPIPSSIVPLALLMIAFRGGNLFPVHLLHLQLHLIVLLFLLSGSLMISKTIRIPKP